LSHGIITIFFEPYRGITQARDQIFKYQFNNILKICAYLIKRSAIERLIGNNRRQSIMANPLILILQYTLATGIKEELAIFSTACCKGKNKNLTEP